MSLTPPTPRRRKIRSVLTLAVSVAVVAVVVRISDAGSLNPPTSTGTATMRSVENIYAPLASAGYDSSGVIGNKDGNALQVAKCIMAKMTGGTPCP
jgi:hypothetical protein